MKDVCGNIALSPMDHETSDVTYASEIPSVKHTNLLYTPGDKTYRDITAAWHAGFGGWSWSARFADLDNDTFQDLYVAQGSRLRPGSVSATFYRNKKGKGFADETKAFGLEDHVPTGSYVYVDLDNDGDLDLVTHPFQLTPVLWRNEAPRGPGLELSLDDRGSPNRRAVGARVQIRAPDGPDPGPGDQGERGLRVVRRAPGLLRSRRLAVGQRHLRPLAGRNDVRPRATSR